MRTLCDMVSATAKALGRGKLSLMACLGRSHEEPTAQGRDNKKTPSAEITAVTPSSCPSSSHSPSASPSTSLSTSSSSSPSSIPSATATLVTGKAARLQESKADRSVSDFLAEAEELLLHPLQGDSLNIFSHQLKDQFRERLLTNAACMLPSYNHQLPNGEECGRFLSLDVGGSTLRVALIELRGQQAKQSGEASMSILSIQSYKITPEVKLLEGMHFFDWMAVHIMETVSTVEGVCATEESPLPMGLAWSFPIEQTSLRGGLLQGMGKGFLAADSLLGQDLGDIIQAACSAKGLHVKLAAIVNDSNAALLSEAYVRTSTRFGLILGTGVNMAVHLPVRMVGRFKYGDRPAAWFDEASHVIINTELGMFGHGILPVTRWDRLLNAGHPKPDFQPLEHLVSGYYLGEVCRFALIEATTTLGLFGGVVPPSLLKPYALDTEILSMIEGDQSPSLEASRKIFHERHPCHDGSAASEADMITVRALASLISRRSAAIISAAVYALWLLKIEAENEYLQDLESSGGESPARRHADAVRAEIAIMRDSAVVAFNGSVIERYPRYLEQCQNTLDQLLLSGTKTGKPAGAIQLLPAQESSLLGAAVSLACLQE